MGEHERRILTRDGVTPVALRPSEGRAHAMPAHLAEVLRLASLRTLSGRRLDEDIDDRTAVELVDLLRAAERRLHERREAMRAFRLDGTSFSAFVTIAACLADGMTYSGRGAFAALMAEPVDPTWKRWLRGAITLAASALSVPKDLRSLAWLVRQPLERGLSGLCRHYATALQAAFFALQRATGRHDDVTVLTVWGRARRRHLAEHAWTWFCDRTHDRVLPVDLTGADLHLDAGTAPTILNGAFDATRFHNVSAFAANLIVGYAYEGAPTYRDERVRALLCEMVGVDRRDGRALLADLTLQRGLDREALRAIRARVGRRRLPMPLARPVVGDAAIQRELIAAMLSAWSDDAPRPARTAPLGVDAGGWGYRSAPRSRD